MRNPAQNPAKCFLSYMDKGVFGAFGIYSMIKSWNADIEPQKKQVPWAESEVPLGGLKDGMRRGQARPGVGSEKTKKIQSLKNKLGSIFV